MNKYYYKSSGKKFPVKIVVRIFGLMLFCLGIVTTVYVFSPLIIWQITLAPAFAQTVEAPIPQHALLTPNTIRSLIATSLQNLSGVNYNDASNWFPGYSITQGNAKVPTYFLSIPKLAISNATVSTTDTNLSEHLVSLSGTGVPPDNGNTVIFGHSTLPQLFNPKDYKTIFANAYKLQIGDTLQVTVNNISYTYTIFNIIVVDPEDTSVLAQQYDDSYLTVITCTPPGTIWKRLVIKSRLTKLQG